VSYSIKVNKVSKKFRLYDQRYTSLKERVIRLGKIPHREFYALNNVDFSVSEGESIGILGRNGSGKSTLLKCIAGILRPSEGEVRVRGRLAAMLELGAGFHPELSGRDNIFLNGSLLGFSKKDIQRKFDEIVAFSELSKFIDTQVKHYSSGMFARLGFAVAINVEPDVLLIDEVLAVGDEAFQAKCIEAVKNFQKQGKTIVLVTHAPDLVRANTTRALVLNEGVLISDATPGESIKVFREELIALDTEKNDQKTKKDDESVWQKIKIKHCQIEALKLGASIDSSSGLKVIYDYESELQGQPAIVSIELHDLHGNLIFSIDSGDLEEEIYIENNGRIIFEFSSMPLLDGVFSISLQIKAKATGEILAWRDSVEKFEVLNRSKKRGLVDLEVKLIHARMDSY
jgi:ABC-2 type transport system ATP-binding protein